MKTTLPQFDDSLLNKRWCRLALEAPPEPVKDKEKKAEKQEEELEGKGERVPETPTPEKIEEILGKVREVDRSFAEKLESFVGSSDPSELGLASGFINKLVVGAFLAEREETRGRSEASRQETLSGVHAATSPAEKPPENA